MRFALVAVASLFLGGLFTAQPAHASCPAPNELGIFWSMIDANTGAKAWATGSTAEIYISNQPYMPTCTTTNYSLAASGQTTRLLLNGTQGNMVEVGYKQRYCSYNVRCWTVFSETSLYGNGGYQYNFTTGDFPCINAVPAWRQFLIFLTTREDGSTVANNYAACSDADPWTFVSYMPAWGYTVGWAEGESFQRWDNADYTWGSITGNIQRRMRWMGAGGWYSAGGVVCRYDDSDGSNNWASRGNPLSGDSFEIVKPGGLDCAP